MTSLSNPTQDQAITRNNSTVDASVVNRSPPKKESSRHRRRQSSVEDFPLPSILLPDIMSLMGPPPPMPDILTISKDKIAPSLSERLQTGRMLPRGPLSSRRLTPISEETPSFND